jgi:hypothetical protein
MSSFPLTNSIIFQDGFLNHQPVTVTVNFFTSLEPCAEDVEPYGWMNIHFPPILVRQGIRILVNIYYIAILPIISHYFP